MKLKMAAIATALFIVLAGCSNSNNGGNAPQSQDPATQNEEAAGQQNGNSSEDDDKGVEVDKGLLDVKITLPASMFEGREMEDVIAEAKQDGVKEVTKNDDGSVTYKMSKSDHKKMLKEMAEEIDLSIEEMQADETFVSIKSITHNDSFSSYTMTVDKAAYEGGMDAFAALGLGIQGMFYQIFEGVDSNKAKVIIDLKDEATGEVFNSIEYPIQSQNE